MPITIGRNIASLRAQQSVASSSDSLAKVFERLGSGLRINRASDDAAGLAIAESLNADARIFSQAIRNVNDGISFLNIADGALQALSAVTTRLSELAEQSANGVYSLEQRKPLQEEADALVDEVNRIIGSTKFNGIQVFTDEVEGARIQAGVGIDSSILLEIGAKLARSVGTGQFESETALPGSFAGPNGVETSDINKDGYDDISFAAGGNASSYFLSNGDGTFQTSQSFGVSGYSHAMDDLNNDGNLDAVFGTTGGTVHVALGNGAGSFSSAITTNDPGFYHFITTGDFNGDGYIDLASNDQSADITSILLGNGDGTFQAGIDVSSGGNRRGINSADLNGDGVDDIVVSDISGSLEIIYGDSQGQFQHQQTINITGQGNSTVIADFDRDGYLDIGTSDRALGRFDMYLGDGAENFVLTSTTTLDANPGGAVYSDFGDIDGDGLLDVLVTNTQNSMLGVLLGNGDGSFQAKVDVTAGASHRDVALGNFEGNGVLDVVVSNNAGNTIGIHNAQTRRSVSMGYINILTQEESRAALDMVSESRVRILSELGNIGAAQSRLEIANNNLKASREAFQQAASQIQSADYANESAQLTRLGILQQAGTAVLTQANQAPVLALQLLQ